MTALHYFTESRATGQYDAMARNAVAPHYPRRIGAITGGKASWLAEAGPLSLGYHKSRKAALAAIVAHVENTVTIHIHGKPVILTAETIAATYQWFADHHRLCASEASAGAFFVNDLPSYVADCERQALEYEAKKLDGAGGRMSLTFIQRAYFIQSGESVPMLAA